MSYNINSRKRFSLLRTFLKWSYKPLNKIELRQKINQQRREVDSLVRQKAAEDAAKLFVTHPIFTAALHIGCYMARPDEFDCFPLIEKIWEANKNCYVPVLRGTKSLEFAIFKKEENLIENCYKNLEPAQPQVISIEKLDLVIAPLVAFDRKGNRLGMGGGYYDRTFGRLQKRPLLIGLAYQFQEVEEIAHDEWDVRLDGVLTESGVFIR